MDLPVGVGVLTPQPPPFGRDLQRIDERASRDGDAVVEAAVVGRPHEVKGEAIVAFVICKGERPTGEAADKMVAELRAWVGDQIGAIAKPDDIRFADGLPKTRSGKIMRRLLRTIAAGEEITSDTSTLENEAVVAQLQGKA